MRIEFLKEHGGHPAGRTVDHPHPGVAETLILRGIARPAPLAGGVPTVDPPAAKAVKVAKPTKPKRVK